MKLTKAYFEVPQRNSEPVRWITIYSNTYQNTFRYFTDLIQTAKDDGFVFDEKNVIIEQAATHSQRHRYMYAIRVEVNDNTGNYQEFSRNPFDF